MRKRLIVGVTGASGSALALETLLQLASAGVETHLVISQARNWPSTMSLAAMVLPG